MTLTKDQPNAVRKPGPAAQTLCYIHPERKAVGVCSICRRGICRSCQVISKGRRFCKPDAEILRRQEQSTAKMLLKRRAIRLGAVFAFLDGLAGTVVGFLLIIIGLIGPQAQDSYSLTSILQPFFTYFADVLKFPSSQALEIGLFAFVLGLVDLMAGFFLLKRSRLAGIIAICVSVLGGVLVGSYLVILALAGFFTYVYVVSALVKVVLIGIGFKHLDER
jgi:hypothetical protein